MIEFTDVGYAKDIEISSDGKYVKFPVPYSIVRYIIGEFKEIRYEKIMNGYMSSDKFCTEVTIYRIVGVEFTDGTVKKYTGVDL